LISVTVIGEIREGQEVLRSGGSPGDLLYVSGTLGQAEHGLRLLRKTQSRIKGKNDSLRKHLYPEPRVALGRWLAERKLATAMMDVSDGLSSDLPRLCTASGVGAVIDPGKLPLLRGIGSDSARALALHGGDDYELLFTVSRRNAARIPAMFHRLRLRQIGELTRGRNVRMSSKNGTREPLPVSGWDPFR
jgi:thiamine-monophosphate kinase